MSNNLDRPARLLLRIMYEKNKQLYLHSLRCADIAQGIYTNLPEIKNTVREETIAIAAKLHDIGKLLVPDEILETPKRYTGEERRIMDFHPIAGAELLLQYFNGDLTDEAEKVIFCIRHHHERFDGSGYPSGLKGTNNPIITQIIGLSDYYAALTEKRAYREPLSREEVRNCLREDNHLFHPGIINALLTHVEHDIGEKLDRKQAASE